MLDSHMRVISCNSPKKQAPDVPGTDVTASTLHSLLELDGSLHSKLDFGKVDDPKVALLMQLQVPIPFAFYMMIEVLLSAYRD